MRIRALIYTAVLSISTQWGFAQNSLDSLINPIFNGNADYGIKIQNLGKNTGTPSLLAGIPPYTTPGGFVSDTAISWTEGYNNTVEIVYTPDSLTVISTFGGGISYLNYALPAPKCITSIQFGIRNFISDNNAPIELLLINAIKFNEIPVNPDSIILPANNNIFYKISDPMLSRGFKLEFQFFFKGNSATDPNNNSIELLLGGNTGDPVPLNASNTSFSVTPLDSPDSTTICRGERLQYTASGGSQYQFFIGENITQPFASDSIFIIDSLNNGQQVGVNITDGVCIFTRNLNFQVTVFEIPPIPTIIRKEVNFCAPTSITSNKTIIVNGDTIRWKVINAPSGSGLSFNQILNPGFSNSHVSITSKGDSLIMSDNPTQGLYQFVTQGFSSNSGCLSEFSDTLTVQVNLTPVLSVLTTPIICSEQPIQFSNPTISNGVSVSSFNYLSSSSNTLLPGTQNKPLPAINQNNDYISTDLYLNTSGQNQTVIYTISANGINGCISDIQEFGFKILAQPLIQSISDTTLANRAALGKIFTIQPNYSARDTFRLDNLIQDQDLVPFPGNKPILTLGNANFLSDEKWTNLNLRSRKVRYTIGIANPEFPGFCSFSTAEFTATIAPDIKLSWAPDALPFNPLDTVSVCIDNARISYRLKPGFRLNQGEKMRLILLPVSEGSIIPEGVTSSLIKNTRDTFTITNIVTTFLTRTDNIVLSTPIYPATITYKWLAQWEGQDGTVFESEPILVNFRLVESDLIFSFDPNLPSQSGGIICSGEQISVEITGTSPTNLYINGVSHSITGPNGPWLSGYGPLTGSANFQVNDAIPSNEINEILTNSIQQKVWLKYDVLSTSSTSAIQCNPYSSSFIVAVQSGFTSTIKIPNGGRTLEPIEKVCAASLPMPISLEWSAPVTLQNGQRMAINLLDISTKSGGIISNLVNGNSINDTLNSGSPVKKIFRDTISLSSSLLSPGIIQYVFESTLLDSDTVVCKKDTIYQIYRIIPSPTITLSKSFDDICSGNNTTLTLNLEGNIEELDGNDYFLALTDVKYSLTDQPGSWWNGYGPVSSTNPIYPGTKFNTGSSIQQALSHTQNYSVYVRFTFSAVVNGTSGPCTVSSREYKVLVNPAPRFVNTLPNLSKKTSEDGSGNCSVAFSWNHPQIVGGNSPILYFNISNPPPDVTPGAPISLSFGPGQHTISYSLVSGCDTKFTSFTITVTDDENPTITCPKNDTLSLDGESNVLINYTIPVVSDNCIDTELLRIRGPIPGQRVGEGIHPVTYLGFDRGGRLVHCNFTIVVLAGSIRSSSSVSCEDRIINTVSLDDDCGVHVIFDNPDCAGDCAGASIQLVSGYPSGSFFSVGQHEVQFRLTDRNGIGSNCQIKVNVQPPNSRSISCQDVSLILPYGETYMLKLTDFLSIESVKDACGGMPSDVRIEPGQLNCEVEMNQSPITVRWKNSMGQQENCHALLTVTRTGKPEFGALIPSFVNTTNGIFSSDPCNTNAAYQLGVTTQSRTSLASGFAYSEICGNIQLTTRLKSMNGFGQGGIQFQSGTKSVALVVEKSFEGVKQVLRLKGLINRGDGKGVETIVQTEGKMPQYLSLTRSGSMLNGKYSLDGITWISLFSINESFLHCINAGLFVFSPLIGPEVRGFFEFIEIDNTTEATSIPHFSNQNLPGPQVYPNPFRDEITIRGVSEWNRLEWMDLNGKIIVQIENGGETISTAHLKSGVYFLRIFLGNEIYVKKVIKTE
jgi:hypothetical protein